MTTKSTEETKAQGNVKVPVGVVAEDMGLNHEVGPGGAQHSVRRSIGKLFDRVQGASWKRS